MTPNTVLSARSPGRARTTAGVVVAFLGAIALTMGVAGTPAAGLENAPLERHVAQSGADCSDGVLVGMNFVVDPVDDDYFFDSITMNVGGDVYTFSGGDLVPNGGSADNVFVAAPAGLGYDDVASATFSAEIGPFGYGYPNFVWSFVCEPAPTTTTAAPTTTTTTTTVAPTTTTTVAETTTTVAGESQPPTTTSAPTTTDDTVENLAPTTVATGNNSPTTVATQLPQTGSTNTMLALGALLLLVGGVMVLSTRREHLA